MQQLSFSWLDFTIDLGSLSKFLSSTYPTDFNGIIADSDGFQIIFNSSVPTNAQDIIQTYLNSLSATSEDLKLAIYRKNEQVNALRDSKMAGGFSWNGHVYDTTDVSRLNLTAAASSLGLGVSLPSNFTWRSVDNINVPMNNQQLATFAISMMTWVSTIYAVSWNHKEQISNLTSSEAIEAYDITVGWPS